MTTAARPNSGLVQTARAWAGPVVVGVLTWLLCYRFGGYFARHWAPAALVLTIWAGVVAVQGRLPALRSPGGLLLGAGVALTAWTGLSMSWAWYSSHAAWEEAARTWMYVAALAIGAATCAAARSWVRMATACGVALALVPVSTLVRMTYVDAPTRLFSGYRVDAPIGYVNGLAAVCALAMLLLAGVAVGAVDRRATVQRSVALRGVIAATAVAGVTASACVLLMVQSRGAVAALAIAGVVAIVLTPARGWLVAFLAASAATAWLIRDALDAPFRAVGDFVRSSWELNDPRRAELSRAAVDAIRHAGVTALTAAVLSGLVVGIVVTVVTGRRAAADARAAASGSGGEGTAASAGSTSATMHGLVGLGVLLVAIAALLIPLGSHRSGASWAVDQARGCLRTQPKVDTSATTRTSHFSDVGTNRCDFWRVALRNARAHPLTGIGAGNFQGTYVKYGRSSESPKQAHSLPLQMLGELGIIGAALAAVMAATVLWAMWRFAVSGGNRDPVFACGIAALVYWGVHASVDWLWNLPGITLPVMVLAGGLVACLSRAQVPVPRAPVGFAAAGLAVIAIAAMLPLAYGDAQLERARQNGGSPAQVRARLDAARAAASTDSRWAVPRIREAELLWQLGDRTAARRAASAALRLEPRNIVVVNRAARLGVGDGRIH